MGLLGFGCLLVFQWNRLFGSLCFMLQLDWDKSAFVRWLMSLRDLRQLLPLPTKPGFSLSICYISTWGFCTTTLPTQLQWNICKRGMTRPQSSFIPCSDMNYACGTQGYFSILLFKHTHIFGSWLLITIFWSVLIKTYQKRHCTETSDPICRNICSDK